MKLHIINDIHNDVCHYNLNIEYFAGIVDAIILSGDYSNTIHHIEKIIKECETYKIPLIFIPGNHEYYNYSIQNVKDYLILLTKQYKFFKPLQLVNIDGKPDIRVYVNEQNKVVFIGDTLWTNYNLFNSIEASKEKCRIGMEEMKFISKFHASVFFNNTSSLISPNYLENICNQSIKTIKKLSFMYKKFGYKVVVVSHHAPHINSIRADYRANQLSPAFGSNILNTSIKTDNIDLWCHGHVHQFYDYYVNNTRVICNPRGYITQEVIEETYFRPELIVEI